MGDYAAGRGQGKISQQPQTTREGVQEDVGKDQSAESEEPGGQHACTCLTLVQLRGLLNEMKLLCEFYGREGMISKVSKLLPHPIV